MSFPDQVREALSDIPSAQAKGYPGGGCRAWAWPNVDPFAHSDAPPDADWRARCLAVKAALEAAGFVCTQIGPDDPDKGCAYDVTPGEAMRRAEAESSRRAMAAWAQQVEAMRSERR